MDGRAKVNSIDWEPGKETETIGKREIEMKPKVFTCGSDLCSELSIGGKMRSHE
jgi:hypothetical protein